MRKLPLILFGAFYIMFSTGCGKQKEWLDAPRNRNDKALQDLKSLQAVLDNTDAFNNSYINIGQLGCDHYYFTESQFEHTPPTERNAYAWNDDIFENGSSLDYSGAYLRIGYANIVLDELKGMEIDASQQSELNNIKGQALFFRSMTFFELASVFCKQYNKQTANGDLGLSLKLTSDIYEIEQRSSVDATYGQIIGDLMDAATLLPALPKYKTRPSKKAVYALLARIYLNMNDYAKARSFSDSVLMYGSELIDFNDGVPSFSFEYRFPSLDIENKEVIFYSGGIGYGGVTPDYSFNNGFVDTILYNSYDNNDLRKKYFYEEENVNRIRFRGTYTGSGFGFCGLGMNEVFLIRAECNARANNIQASLEDLNQLLSKRFVRGRYVSYSTDNVDTLLFKIVEERRKELSFTAQIRWQDLRRLNADPRFAISLTRIIDGQIITLAPNDPKYVYPIPQDEIERTGIAQNER